MNKINFKQLVITLVIVIAGFFGYKVIVEPPVNVIQNNVPVKDSISVDSTFKAKDTTNSQ